MLSITSSPTRLVAALAASLALAAPLSAQTITGTEPVKIFILAGESNTHGKGTVGIASTPGTLENLYANDTTGRYQFLKSGGSYVTRPDVGIRGLVFSGAPNPGNLTVNYGGAATGLIGPELGFGHVIGDVFENKVLIVKVGVDGTTLGGSFCPPSSRIGEPEPVVAGDKGFHYNEIIRLVNEAKASLGTTPYEIVGLGWHQGWNDRADKTQGYNAAYEVNMANFIRDIRSADKGIGVAGMPVVIASAAMDWNYGYSEVERAQLKMADATAYPEFVGNVGVVDTRQPYDGLEFWQPAYNSPADEGFHWNRSGKTFLHIGMAMGDAMSQLVSIRTPFRIRANGGSGGLTLTWNNGTETPTSVRVLRNGVEIAAAAPANPPTFVDATAPLGVNNYELQFTMPVSPCPPLAISHNSNITNLKGGQRANGVRLTWDNNLGYTGITVKRNGSIMAASLPGSTTTYTDSSAPAGAVTYSVEPDDAGGTPTEIQVTVTAAPSGGAVIYEPFDMPADSALPGNEGGIGLDGKWDGGTAIQVTSIDPYTFGSLPMFGNRIRRTTANGSCTIHIGDTLHEAGLMEHGTELWFSFLSQNPNNSNIHPTLALGDDILSGHTTVSMGGNAIGAKLLSGNKVIGTIYSGGTQAVATATQATLAASEVVLVVGRITWGADASAPDTIQIYTPGTELTLDTPLSVSAVVDQSKFKVLSMWGNGAAPNMDEIRFGDSYLDVIGQGTDTSGDSTPPAPATMSFASAPAATSTTAITMTATTATDANGVQYRFLETSGNPGGTDSAWQDSPVYSDTGLNPDTEYTYTVQARDKSVNNNTNTASAPASATTLPPDTTPPSPATMSFATPPAAASTTAITMTASTANDDSGVEYFFDETSGNPGGMDSGWQDSPNYTNTGLNPDTEYTYTVQARDKSLNQNANAASAPASATTLAADTNPPPTPGFSVAPNATSAYEITMTASTVTDPEGGTVQYLFTETSGNPGGSSSGWQSSPVHTDTGLSPNTEYTYTVKARDNATPPNESAASASASATTPEIPPSTTFVRQNNTTLLNTSGAWAPSGTPGAGDVAAWTSAIATAGNRTTALGGSVSWGQILMNATDPGGDITIGNTAGATLTLNGIEGTGIDLSAAARSLTINNPVTLGSSQTWNVNTSRTVTVGNHVISDGGSGHGITKAGAGTLTLQGANTFTGPITATGGTVSINAIANGGIASPLGQSSNAASNLLLGNGTTLTYTGGPASSDRLFTINGTAAGHAATINANGSGALNLTSTAAIAYGTPDQTRTLTLSGANNLANTHVMAAQITNNGSGAVTLSKTGTGSVWHVTNPNNSFTGGVTFNRGFLVFSSGALGSTGTISIGANSAPPFGLRWAPGNTDDISSRFNSTGSTGQCTLDTGANDVVFASEIAMRAGSWLIKEGSGSLTLNTASGWGADANSATLVNAGTLVANVMANGGTKSSIGNIPNTALNFGLRGGALRYIGSGASTDRNFHMSGNNTIDASGSGALVFSQTAVISPTPLSRNFNLTLNSKSTGNAPSSSADLVPGMTVSGTGIPVGTKIVSIGINGSLTFDQNATATGTGVTLTFGSYLAGTLTLTGTNTDANEIKGILRDSVSNIDATTTTLAITKTGPGKWILSGANSYTGPTLVSEGTLALVGGTQASPITVGSAASLGFTLGSPPSSSSSVNLTEGTVVLTGTPDPETEYLLMTATGGITGTPVLEATIPGYQLELRNADTELWLTPANPNTPPAWTSNPVNEIDATVGAAYSGTLADNADDVDAGDTLEFAKISGPAWLSVAVDGTLSGNPAAGDAGPNAFTVSVTDGIAPPVEATLNINVQPAPAPFSTWATSGSNGTVTFNGDTNGDGVTDGLAFLLGAADPDANALALLPKSEKTNGGLKLTFRIRNAATRGEATAIVQWSGDLGAADPWASNFAAVPETTQTVNGLDFQISLDGTLNDIIVTIPSTEAADGKLFGRLSGNEN